MDFIFPVLIVGGGIAAFIFIAILRGKFGAAAQEKARKAKNEIKSEISSEVNTRIDQLHTRLNALEDGKPSSEE